MIVMSLVKVHLVGKVWGYIPTKFQTDPTGNHGVKSLGHNLSTRLMPLGHKVSVDGMLRIRKINGSPRE